jgi:hypothetical protein
MADGPVWAVALSLIMVIVGCGANDPLVHACPTTTAYYLCTGPPETATQATCEDDSNVIAAPVVGTCEPKPGVVCVKACPDGRTPQP